MQIKPLYFQFLVGSCILELQNATGRLGWGEGNLRPMENQTRYWLAEGGASIQSFTHSKHGAPILFRGLSSLSSYCVLGVVLDTRNTHAGFDDGSFRAFTLSDVRLTVFLARKLARKVN